MNNSKVKFILIGLLVYSLSASVSYAAFSWRNKKLNSDLLTPFSSPEGNNGEQQITVDPTEPKTKACPLNGKLYTESERKIWEKRRPLAVMIENHIESRPQSGLSYADIVYEVVAEGGITRFMGIFYCGVAAENVNFAPVRSARTYFLDWVLEYDAFYVHVGGAGNCNDPTVDERAKALCQIDQYGIKDMDQFGLSIKSCYRNVSRTGRTVATEHQMICKSEGLYEESKAPRFWWNNLDDPEEERWDRDFRTWEFAEAEVPAEPPEAKEISFGFWRGTPKFDVRWVYDPAGNSYKRFMGGEEHIDFETKEQLAAKNVVVQFTVERGPVDEHKHLLYDTVGTGQALIFNNGRVIEGTWEKEKRTSRTLYFDAAGKEIKFVPGQVWIEIVPRGNEVEY